MRGFITLDGLSISVFCPYCAKFHQHGWRPDNPPWALEHRVAHCHDSRSPFDLHGYWIGRHLPKELRLEETAEFAAAVRRLSLGALRRMDGKAKP